MMTETSGNRSPDDAPWARTDPSCDISGAPYPAPPPAASHAAGFAGFTGTDEGPDVAALVELARAGDHAAFDTLVALNARPMEIYIAGLIGDDETACDLTQDVFWHAWSRLYELRDPERFRAWLFRAATNRARSWLRRRRIVGWVSLERLHSATSAGQGAESERPLPGESAPPSAESGFEDALAETDTLKRALLRVPLEYRTCLLLHVSLGFSVREVADQLGTTPGAVRMRLHRGLAALREAYRDENRP